MPASCYWTSGYQRSFSSFLLSSFALSQHPEKEKADCLFYKGYADFKQITILSQNDEYAIVKSNTEYGLSVYDHIVLKGDTVSVDEARILGISDIAGWSKISCAVAPALINKAITFTVSSKSLFSFDKS